MPLMAFILFWHTFINVKMVEYIRPKVQKAENKWADYKHKILQNIVKVALFNIKSNQK